MTITLGCAAWDWFTPGVPGPGRAFAEVVGLSLLAAVPLAGAAVLLPRRRPVGSRERPVFSCRMFAGMMCFMGVVVLNLLTDQQQYWPHVHRVIGLVSVPLSLAAAWFWLMVARDSVRQARAGHQ